MKIAADLCPLASKQAESCVEGLMNLLGIQFADSGKKATQFGKKVKALGLVLDLEKFHLEELRICHTDQRIEELDHTLTDILTRLPGTSSGRKSEGRLHWFTSSSLADEVVTPT